MKQEICKEEIKEKDYTIKIMLWYFQIEDSVRVAYIYALFVFIVSLQTTKKIYYFCLIYYRNISKTAVHCSTVHFDIITSQKI